MVEVSIALAIVAFALLPMVALLPVGANSYANAAIRGRAIQVVSQVATCVQLSAAAPVSGSSVQYTALAPFTTITWNTAATSAATFGPFYFDSVGNITTASSGTARFLAVVAISAASSGSTSDPAASMNPLTATITVVWPASATCSWNGVIPQFSNIQGHEESTIPLSPIFQ